MKRHLLRTVLGLVLALVLLPVGVASAHRGEHPQTSGKSALGERQLTLILVEPVNGDRMGLSEEVAREIVAHADAIWDEISAGRIRLRVDKVIKWVEMPGTKGCRRTQAQRLPRQIGWKPGKNRHVVVIEPSTSCPFGGLGEVNGPRSYLQWGVYAPHTHLIGETLAHELGHNFGVLHTSRAGCSTALTPLCGKSAEKQQAHGSFEYGGDDIMGSGNLPLNPVFAARLGLLGRDGIAEVSVDGKARTETFTLRPVNSAEGTRTVRIISRDRKQVWWISYAVKPLCEGRDPWQTANYDCHWGHGQVESGVTEVLRVHTTWTPGGTITAIQQRTADGSPHLTPGQVYTFTGGTLTATVDGSSATITVTINGRTG